MTEAKNASTLKFYSGKNEETLTHYAIMRGYSKNLWATYRQWQEKNLQVKKGEKGVKILALNITEKEKDGKKKTTIEGVKYYTVFNIDQVAKAEPKEEKAKAAPKQAWSFKVNE